MSIYFQNKTSWFDLGGFFFDRGGGEERECSVFDKGIGVEVTSAFCG